MRSFSTEASAAQLFLRVLTCAFLLGALFSPVLLFGKFCLLGCLGVALVKAVAVFEGRRPGGDEKISGQEMTESGFWIIRGAAYDLTNFMQDHPGGAYVLETTRGTDCTALFTSYHAASNRNIDMLMQRFHVREAHAHELYDSMMWEWDSTPVYDELKGAILRYKARCGIKLACSNLAVGLHVVLFWCWLYLLRVWWSGAQIFPRATPQYFLTMVCLAYVHLRLIAGMALHEGFHYSICKSSFINELIGTWLGVFHHFPGIWFRKHTVTHHPYVNIEGKDPDLAHFEGWFRVTGESKTCWWYAFWPGFFSFVAALHSWGTALWDALLVLTGEPAEGIGSPRWTRREQRCLSLQAFLYATAILAGTYRNGIAHTMLPWILVSIFYYLGTEFQHIQESSFADVKAARTSVCNSAADPTKTGKRPEWVVQQLLSCQGDYAIDRYWITVLLGGMNAQALHHIFPSVSACHLPMLAEEVMEICAKHGVSYRPHPGILTSLLGYFRWLAKINRSLDHCVLAQVGPS